MTKIPGVEFSVSREFHDETIAQLQATICDMARLLQAASHALRSYQYGNSATELAEEMANTIDAALAPKVKP